MEQRISLVTLGVRDLARSREFYAALGWHGRDLGEVVFHQAGGLVVALWGRDELALDSCTHDTGGWGGITLSHNVASPEAVDAVLAEAEGAGAHVARAGAPTPWGGYSGVFHDPDGHAWEVAHNPAWPLAADGTVSLGDQG